MTMLSNETVRKLHEMRLGVMAEAFSAQLEDAQFQAVSFEDRFAMLVDAEWSARKSNRLTRLIRNAGYADPAACVENIQYHAGAQGWTGSRSCAWPPVPTSRKHTMSSSWEPTGAGKTYSGLRPWHGSQPQFLLRPVHPPAGSAGGDLCGPG